MEQDRWIQIDELFHAALKREPSDRMAFLANACGADDTLRNELEALLSADSDAGSFLERGSGRIEMMLEPGAQLGAYRIDALIGRGGMGEVYRAHDTRLAREVAIKVLPCLPTTRSQPPPASEKAAASDAWEASTRLPLEGATFDGLLARNLSLRRRFESEALLTASVQHPAVVPIYERGQLPGGQPFYTMKLISGRSLYELISDRKALADRLALLPNVIAVADALAHAHSLHILHRDVKPSNIIIGEFGETVLIDWGVAKNLGAGAGEPHRGAVPDEANRTALGSIIGTPAYMSPEQARGLPADQRADVFSLGATLYHLLAGQAAYEGDTPTILPRVAQGEYLPLSERLPDVSPELAAIVDKAMAPEAAERYPSARELAEDLRRFQTGQLVHSHRYSARELFARWARRHRPLLVASAVFLAVSAAGAAFGVNRILRERDRANREAEVSQRVSQFMTEMFKVSDPSEARGNKVTAREILDKASSEIDSGLQRDPAVQANLMDAMARVYESLGLYAKARPLAEKAVERRRKLLGALHPDTLRSMTALATIERDQGQYAAAGARHLQVLEARRHLLGPEHPETLLSMSNLATAENGQGHYVEAEKLHQQVLEVRRRLLGPEHSDTLYSMHNLATVQMNRGDHAAAEKGLREVLEIRRRVQGSDHPETLRAMANLANVYRAEGRDAESEKMHREVLEIQRRVLGPEHPATLSSMNAVAVAEIAQGHWASAAELFKEVLEIRRRVLGPEHPDTLISGHNLASNLLQQGRALESLAINREVLQIRRRVLGPEHHQTLMTISSLAENERLLGHYQEAEKLFREFLDTARRTLGPEHPDLIIPMRGLGALYLSQRRTPEAERIHREAVELGRRVLGPEHPSTLRSMHRLAEAESALGRYEEAEKLSRDTLEVQRRVFKRDNADIADALIGLAHVEARQGRRDEAEKLYSEALAMSERLLGSHHPQLGLSLYGLGALALERGNRSKALDYLQRAFDQGLSISKRMEMRSDPELKPLRGDPRFEALIAE